MGVMDVFRQIGSRVVAGNSAFAKELFELPSVHLSEHPGLSERKNATAIEGESQLAPNLALGFVRGEPESVNDICGNFEN